MKAATVVAGLVLALQAAFPLDQAPAPPIFRVSTNEFWLNLHHFLYVLGRAESGASNSNREAVAGAPAEAERGLKGLTADERKVWGDAVSTYATGLSLKDAVREAPLPAVTASLADAGDAPALTDVAIEPAVRDTLERAAPIYRQTWWPAHHAANQAWRSSIDSIVATHGQTILTFITKAYGMEWPTAGYAVHASGYSTFGGAYSSVRGVLVISSLAKSSQGFQGLETIFHEGMHQWDNQVYSALGAQARPIKAMVPSDLPHALIWVTAGEAVRRVSPAHVRLVDALGIWKLFSSGALVPLERLKAPLDETWMPYLNGRGTRDEAMRALLEKIAAG
jgi:hypothetical protein